jgi:energy-coupling factor transport system ATP-binding protein
VVLAEHRMERVIQYADRLVVTGDGPVRDGAPATMMVTAPVAPPVVQLGRLAGWSPLPLSVRDARRLAGPLRERLQSRPVQPSAAVHVSGAGTGLRARKVSVGYGNVVAVREVSLDLAAGEVVALMGRNGSGKSSLLWALQGSGPCQGGTVDVGGKNPRSVPAHQARRLVGLVPQTPGDLLYLNTVAQECAQADKESAVADGSCRALLDRFVPGVDASLHPADLSEGQRLALVLAIQLVAAPPIMLLDEPTRGLDYPAKERFAEVVRELAAAGRCVVLATHDVEFVAATAHRVIVLADGEIVADGPTADVVVASPAFAPQVAKVLAPQGWLTVAQVAEALRAGVETEPRR